jgi:hypothetical protein
MYLFPNILSCNSQPKVPGTSTWSNDITYLLTAIQFPPGGSRTVHIYTQTVQQQYSTHLHKNSTAAVQYTFRHKQYSTLQYTFTHKQYSISIVHI